MSSYNQLESSLSNYQKFWVRNVGLSIEFWHLKNRKDGEAAAAAVAVPGSNTVIHPHNKQN